MSTITPSPRNSSHRKGGSRRNENNNKIYANPLPVTFTSDEKAGSPPSHLCLGLFGYSTTRVLNPHCEAVFDAATRSAWVTNPRDSKILWRRGFFGKGNLSRSEPSWLARRVSAMQAAEKGLTAEQVTAKRRAERRQFKIDRAKAMAEAAAIAEAAFQEGRVITTEETGVAIPSAATWKPHIDPSNAEFSGYVAAPQREEGSVAEDEETPEDVEHLQLTLSETFFLLWTLDCLTVLDQHTNEPLTLQQLWRAYQAAYLPPILPAPLPEPTRFDNPFLIDYVVYHHYRSLGWVVKNGIKFCADYLLYKRGPVFHHAEFAIVACPVYEDPTDQETSPFNLQNASPFPWSWLSTINRVNSQVQKTLILTYVVIPAQSRISSEILSSPACLQHYSVREVVVRRFIPARMRS